MRGYRVFVVAGVAALSVVSVRSATADVVVYTNDFEGAGPAGNEWSMWDGNQWGTAPTDTTPGTGQHPADKFLGQFGNNMVTLTLNNLPAHAEVTVSFDLFVIRSWDGNFDEDARGPDYWAIDEGAVPQAPEDWDWITTFSNWDPSTGPHQAYPGEYGVGDNAARTGAAENDTLGFLFNDGGGPFIQDAVYEFAPLISHTGSSLTITFGADHLQALADESWGLDDVTVALDVPEPATLSLLALVGLFVIGRRR